MTGPRSAPAKSGTFARGALGARDRAVGSRLRGQAESWRASEARDRMWENQLRDILTGAGRRVRVARDSYDAGGLIYPEWRDRFTDCFPPILESPMGDPTYRPRTKLCIQTHA